MRVSDIIVASIFVICVAGCVRLLGDKQEYFWIAQCAIPLVFVGFCFVYVKITKG